MSWTNKSKTRQQEDDGKILTPDGYDIVVGENEDEVLIYSEGFNNWGQGSKTPGSWSLKQKG